MCENQAVRQKTHHGMRLHRPPGCFTSSMALPLLFPSLPPSLPLTPPLTLRSLPLSFSPVSPPLLVSPLEEKALVPVHLPARENVLINNSGLKGVVVRGGGSGGGGGFGGGGCRLKTRPVQQESPVKKNKVSSFCLAAALCLPSSPYLSPFSYLAASNPLPPPALPRPSYPPHRLRGLPTSRFAVTNFFPPSLFLKSRSKDC